MIVALLVFPAVVAMSGALGAAILGYFLKKTADDKHEGSELIEFNR
jgi:ABC-type Na+ efflux pump permease subunit